MEGFDAQFLSSLMIKLWLPIRFAILGLQALHEITTSGSYQLRVDLEDWESNITFAEYS